MPRGNQVAPEEGAVRIALNDLPTNAGRRYPSNYIRTAKYTLLTFVPKNIFEQFRRFSNFYFLLNAVLSLIPSISPIGPFTSVTPLVFVLTISAVKDAVEDYQRHRADKVANATPYVVYRNNEELVVRSEDIVVGDTILVLKAEQFPADLVVVHSSQDAGVCYVETSNLDGESNLKRRMAPAHFAEKLRFVEREKVSAHLTGEIVCEPASEHLYKFEGKLIDGAETRSLSHNQLLLRGARLRNTKWIVGVVVYAGNDTKMYKNLNLSAAKFSHLEKRLNHVVLGVFALNVALLLYCAVMAGMFQMNSASKMNYFGDIAREEAMVVASLHILTYFILFTYMIPISLFVTMEVVRFCQAQFMVWDDKMKSHMHAEEDPTNDDAGRIAARNSNMNEELGMIEHIFSDKTGTLTCNIMKLTQWSIGGILYNVNEDPFRLAREIDHDTAAADDIKEFLRAITLCNTVVPEMNLLTGGIDYEAQSPDEAALVESASDASVVLLERRGSMIQLQIAGVRESYELLATLEFSSDRKRMSVVVRQTPNAAFPKGQIKLYCKGADSKLFGFCRSDDPLRNVIAHHVHDAAKEGLRTLVVASRVLEDEEFEAWVKDYAHAENLLAERAKAVEEVCGRLEVDLTLLGSTSVEDKLQESVPRTLQYLLDMQLSVWLLTGDKQETAENIGYSSSLLPPDTNLIRLNCETSDECARAIDEGIISCKEKGARPSLIVDGATLELALNDHPKAFLSLGARCQSVLCCRVTPLQKAKVVSLVKDNLNRVTLAIGDGANDVSMIQAADVGVGIMGREGTQAVRAADYALGEFRFLSRLVAVHGRYSYVRLSLLIQYSFYKNLTYIIPQFIFGFYSGFSGQIIYDDVVMASFNIVWAFAPPFILGIFEKDIPEAMLERYPQLYARYRVDDDVFTLVSFAKWVVAATYHAIVIYFFSTVGAGHYGCIHGNGKTSGLWVQAMLTSSCGVTVVLLKSALVIRHWNVFNHLAVWGSLLGYYLFILLYTSVPLGVNDRIIGVGWMFFSTPVTYLTIMLVVVACLLPDITLKYLYTIHQPSMAQVLRERMKLQLEDPKDPDEVGLWDNTPLTNSSSDGDSDVIL